MKRNLSLLMAAGAIAFAPGMTFAAPPGGGGGGAAMHGPMNSAPAMQRTMPTARPTTTTTTTTTTATPQSPTGNGGGYNHLNSPQHATGQPSQECEELIASGEGSAPGHAADNGSSAFGGTAGDKYAGSQPQNSRNTASVSQYDTACARPQ